jgi:hypothetical protein
MIDCQSTDKAQADFNGVYVTILGFIRNFFINLISWDNMRVKTPEGLGPVGVPNLFDYQ